MNELLTRTNILFLLAIAASSFFCYLLGKRSERNKKEKPPKTPIIDVSALLAMGMVEFAPEPGSGWYHICQNNGEISVNIYTGQVQLNATDSSQLPLDNPITDLSKLKSLIHALS